MARWVINRPKATITCSKCKARLNAKLFMDLLEAWNFCPYCGADMRAEQTEPQTERLEQFRVGLEYHTNTTHFGKVKGESITTNKIEDEPQTEREGE